MYRRLLSLWAAIVLLLVGILPANASAYGRVQIGENKQLARYVCSSGPITPAASPTAIFVYKGSASKTVYIDRIEMSYSCSNLVSSLAETFYLKKRSTANSGGTSTTITPVPLDSSSAAASSSGLICYTANPSSLGTAVGDLRVFPVHASFIYNAGHSGQAVAQMTVFDAVANHGPHVLRGTSESIELNFNGATVLQTTPKFWLTIYLSEE